MNPIHWEKYRADLIEHGQCDLKCLSHGPAPCCADCAKYKGWYDNERDELHTQFTIDEQKQIKQCWDEKTGFLGENGCKLPRRLRSYTCLSTDCKKAPPGVAH